MGVSSILSLLAIVEKIIAQGAYTIGLMHIDLAIGLMSIHLGTQNKTSVRCFKCKEPAFSEVKAKSPMISVMKSWGF